MNTIMNDNDIKTLPQVRAFLDGTGTVEFTLQTKSERYDFGSWGHGVMLNFPWFHGRFN